jgi:SH3-like domain-containing protein
METRTGRVARTYKSQYPDPICFDAGVPVQVERGDGEFPGWFWCRTQTGKEGWVHHSFLAGRDGTTTSVLAYSAKELTVMGGERATLINLLDGWAYIRLDDGREGWIPESHFDFNPGSLGDGGLHAITSRRD